MKITEKDYYMGRDVSHASELTPELKANTLTLLNKVNMLIARTNLPGFTWQITSGWWPASINAQIGGAKSSKHITCQAIDFHDPEARLTNLLVTEDPLLLAQVDMAMESPDYCIYEKADGTRGHWVHLQSVLPLSGNRIFIPYFGPPKIRRT